MADAAVADAATSRFVAACDAALEQARRLKASYEAAGDGRAVQARRAIDLIEGRRRGALDGTLHPPSSGVALGFTRFIGDVDWGPEGQGLLDAAYAAERCWKQEL